MAQSKRDFAPPYPWTGKEPTPPTRKALARCCYVDAMFCRSMARYETARGNNDTASQWHSFFETYRDLHLDFETNDPDMPMTTVLTPVACSTPDCSGVWWDTTSAVWSRKRDGHTTPVGYCRRCTGAA